MRLLLIWIFLIAWDLVAQPDHLFESLAESYDQYRETGITHKRIKHSDISPLFDQLRVNEFLRVQSLGKSIV